MKFAISSDALSKLLNSFFRIVHSKSPIPILDNFLFRVKENYLNITASDLENTMTADIEIESDSQDWEIAVPAKLIIDILKSFPEKQILSFSYTEKVIKICSELGSYSITVKNAEEFPSTPTLENPKIIYLKAEIFSRAISNTSFAISNDELRPTMNGLLFQIDNEGMTVVGTDALKLVKFTNKCTKSNQKSQFILTKKTINLLKKILDQNYSLKIEYNSTDICFSFNNKKLKSRLIEGTYPDYEAVIPKKSSKKLIVDRINFLNSIKRLFLFSNRITCKICLKMSSEDRFKLKIIAEDNDFSHKACESINCCYIGDDFIIGFNSKFLIEMLSHLRSKKISIEMTEPNRAGVLKPVDGFEENEEVLMLVMPIYLNTFD